MVMGSSKILRWMLKAMNFVRVPYSASYWPGIIQEPFTGAWQKNVTLDRKESLLRNSAVYACVTGIATDVSKMRIKLDRNENGIWTEITTGSPWLPVLRKPNHYQNRIKFIEQWILSKLLQGNAFILKQREEVRGLVNGMYVLDPRRVTPLVSEDGGVYYQLGQDHLSQVTQSSLIVPASEIIHDMMPALWHPLVGVPPLYACAMSATVSNRIQQHSATFFENRSLPGGVLTAPGHITDDTAKRLKEDFEKRYSGENIGRLVVAGDGLKFEPMTMTAEAAQVAEQFKMSTEDIARAFHYPLFKLGGPLPPYAGNVEALITNYYTDCLQSLIECVELSLDEGLELPAGQGTELDLDNLMRMDTPALYEALDKGVGGGWMEPNEARFKANFGPVEGGNTPYLQQQNFSLSALAKRDAREDPFATAKPAESAASAPASQAHTAPAKSFDRDDVKILCLTGLQERRKKREVAA
jgi:HK97 family phage portal protein